MRYESTMPIPRFALGRRIDRLFENTFVRGQAAQQTVRSEWVPPVDIRETDHELTFVVELPGITLDDVEVTAAEGVLTIHGEKKELLTEGVDGRYMLSERNYGSFKRRFSLPQGVDGERIEANVDGGLLEVRIPKAALPQPTKIHITAGAVAT